MLLNNTVDIYITIFEVRNRTFCQFVFAEVDLYQKYKIFDHGIQHSLTFEPAPKLLPLQPLKPNFKQKKSILYSHNKHFTYIHHLIYTFLKQIFEIIIEYLFLSLQYRFHISNKNYVYSSIWDKRCLPLFYVKMWCRTSSVIGAFGKIAAWLIAGRWLVEWEEEYKKTDKCQFT